MAIFKCKICGGTLEITSGETVATCEYCGTKQTLPKLDDEKKANLFDRANHFRRNNDFDKAMGIYEQILNEDAEDAESYWSIVLCRYGIEYVEDPSSHKRVPTVNRAQFTSVFDDEDYKSAIKYADAHQKELYEKEATAINEIQKGILAISGQEEPFDVFICYKETDANGRRTQDSVLATELYHELTREGYKVFFSRITLEDKLGTAYEPYIFAALNSSKVMVVLGTKPEHFNAVWVKNEWSRYLALIKQGQKKMLIPAYRDMDPYDLPEEFSHLQAQNMSKLGFMQDLVRGITKLVSVDNASAVKETVVVQSTVLGNASALVKRGFLALEDGDWNKADEFFEQALNQDAEDAQAYLGKLMAELRVNTQDELKNCKEPFDSSTNYQKAIRFADSSLAAELKGDISFIKDRNEEERLNQAYTNSVRRMEISVSEDDYKSVASVFKSIQNYKDSKELYNICIEKAEIAKKELLYNTCMKVFRGEAPSTIENWESAISGFKYLGDYKDSYQKADECLANIERIKREAEEERIKKERELEEKRLEQERKRLEEERKKEQERIAKEKAKKRNKKLAIIITFIVALVIAFVVVLNVVIIPNSKYNAAVALMNEGKYEEAISAFELLDGYKDSDNKIEECESAFMEQKYQLSLNHINNGDLTKAVPLLMTISNYKDSYSKIVYLVDKLSRFISANGSQTHAINDNGDMFSVGYNVDLFNIKSSALKEIVLGGTHAVGLKSNGQVVAHGSNRYGETNVNNWENIIKVAAGYYSTIGLKSDGTVVQTGIDRERDMFIGVNGWTNIVDIIAPSYYTVGLKSDGTVVSAGESSIFPLDVSNWNDIVSIYSDEVGLLGLKASGEVVISYTGINKNFDVSKWKNITDVAMGGYHIVGLRNDGSVIATGNNQRGQCNVEEWQNIVDVCVGDTHTVGLKSDGTVVAIGLNNDGQCNVDTWSDIIAISAGTSHTIGLKSDGTLVAVGANESGQCDVENWDLFD